MSDSDSFIDEVTQELKRDRMFALWKRYGVFVIAAIVLIVAGAAAKTWWDAEERAAMRETGARLSAAAELEDPAARAAAFAEIAEGGNGALVARFGVAEARMQAGDAAGAAEALDAIASDETVERVYRDLAALKSVQYQYADRTPSGTIAALEPLIADDAPFRLLALEMRAAAHMAAGDDAAARADLQRIAEDDFVTNDLRQRVSQLMALLGPEEG